MFPLPTMPSSVLCVTRRRHPPSPVPAQGPASQAQTPKLFQPEHKAGAGEGRAAGGLGARLQAPEDRRSGGARWPRGYGVRARGEATSTARHVLGRAPEAKAVLPIAHQLAPPLFAAARASPLPTPPSRGVRLSSQPGPSTQDSACLQLRYNIGAHANTSFVIYFRLAYLNMHFTLS